MLNSHTPLQRERDRDREKKYPETFAWQISAYHPAVLVPRTLHFLFANQITHSPSFRPVWPGTNEQQSLFIVAKCGKCKWAFTFLIVGCVYTDKGWMWTFPLLSCRELTTSKWSLLWWVKVNMAKLSKPHLFLDIWWHWLTINCSLQQHWHRLVFWCEQNVFKMQIQSLTKHFIGNTTAFWVRLPLTQLFVPHWKPFFEVLIVRSVTS